MLLDPSTPSPTLPPRVLPGMLSLLVALVLLVGAMGSVPVLAGGGEEEVDFERRVVWDADGTYVRFIPASLIREIPLDDLTELDKHLGSLRWMIDNRDRYPLQSFSGAPPECLDPVSPPRPLEPEDPGKLQSWLELATNNRLVFVGEVRAVVSGWATSHYQVGRAVYIEVDRVLRDTQGVLEPGEVLPFVIPDGRIVVHGATLCWEIDPFAYQPEPGDSVLFLGAAYSGGNTLAAARFFSASGGIVQTDQRRSQVDQPSKSIDELAWELVAAGAHQ